MTDVDADPDHAKAADMLVGFSGNDFADFFVDGFRAFATGDGRADAEPFGPVYAYLFVGEDITDDLAAVHHILEERSYPITGRGAHKAFSRGLCAAFERLRTSMPEDRVAMKYVLRLAAKIQCVDMLAQLTRKVFDEPSDEDESASDLRTVAVESILNLVSGNADAGNHLRDIAQSSFFRSEDVDTVFFALCEAEPSRLAHHLALLQDALIDVYGGVDSEVDDALLARRVLFVLDMGVPPSVLGGVVEFAVLRPDWRLAWIGDALQDAPLTDLGEEDQEKADRLLLQVSRGGGKPDEVASILGLDAPVTQSLADRRAAFEVLSSDEFDGPEELNVADKVIGSLGGPSHDPEADLPRAA